VASRSERLSRNAHRTGAKGTSDKDYKVEWSDRFRPEPKGRRGAACKLERATRLINKLERGRSVMPSTTTAGCGAGAERVITWTGWPTKRLNQLDAAAYAARHAAEGAVRRAGRCVTGRCR